MILSPAYQSILTSLNYINKGDARDFSLVWVSQYKCRVVHDDDPITSICVDHTDRLDQAVADWLRGYSDILAKTRFRLFFDGLTCPI